MRLQRIRIDTDFHRKNTDSPQEIVACLFTSSSFLKKVPVKLKHKTNKTVIKHTVDNEKVV